MLLSTLGCRKHFAPAARWSFVGNCEKIDNGRCNAEEAQTRLPLFVSPLKAFSQASYKGMKRGFLVSSYQNRQAAKATEPRCAAQSRRTGNASNQQAARRQRMAISKWTFLMFSASIQMSHLAFGETATVNGITWTYTVLEGKVSIGSGTYSNIAIPASTQGTITIPSSMENYPVTAIGDFAFEGCTQLTEVIIPNGVITIGQEAFRGCSQISSVSIPDSVTNIGYLAFCDCRGLSSIVIPPNVECTGERAFFGCSGLTNVTISSGVKCISDFSFYECSGVREIEIPSSVTKIDDYAFAYCSGLKDVTIPLSVAELGTGAFAYCSGLKDITIPSSVLEIGIEAFSDCDALTNVTISTGVISIGHRAFYECSGLTKVTIPSSVTHIGESAFKDCRRLKNITIPDSVTSIRHSAFYDCSELANITIPSSVTSIDDYAFYRCSALNSVTIPNSVISIGKWSFAYCSGLSNVTITSCHLDIGINAFYRNNSTPSRNVVFLDDVPNCIDNSYIIENASTVQYLKRYEDAFAKIVPAAKFGGYVKWNVTFDANEGLVGSSHVIQYTEVEHGVNLTDAIGELPMPERMGYDFKGWFTDKDGGTQILDTNTVIADATYYAHWEENDEGCVVDGVRWLYQDCEELGGVEIIGIAGNVPQSLIIPSELADRNVVAIGDYAFSPRYSLPEYNTITNVVLNAGLIRLSHGAFEACANLESVVIPSSITTVHGFVFADCHALVSVKIEEGVCALNECCFAGCDLLSEIELPSTITNLERAIFQECYCLTNVTFNGAKPSLIWGAPFEEDNGMNDILWQVPIEITQFYVRNICDWEDENHNRLTTWFGRTIVYDPLPDIGDNATAEDIAEAFDGVQDGRLTAHITDKNGYSIFRHWLNRACGSDFSMRQAVKDSAHAWLSFALDADALIVTLPKQGDVKIDTFKPSATSGAFDFDISVENIAIGEGATAANLAEIFGIEGATTPNGDYSSSDVEISFETPADGKVKCTARPKDASAKSFFMKVRMTP